MSHEFVVELKCKCLAVELKCVSVYQ